jgi:Na+/phosphate symporter
MYLNVESVNLFEQELLNDNQKFNTNVNINKIEDFINNILNKHQDLCKYYFNITENYWSVSFNVGMDQLEAMCKSAFEINLYKDNNNNSIIVISNEINDFEQWSDLYRDLIKKLKN